MTLANIGAGALVSTLALAAPTSADHTVSIDGRLDDSDERLADGEYYEVHTLEVAERGPLEVVLNAAFDGYLIVLPPVDSGLEQIDNDDWEGDLTVSRVQVDDALAGEWRVAVTTASAGVGGNYVLSMTAPGLGPDAGAVEWMQGELGLGDPTLVEGEHFDLLDLELAAGERAVVTLTSGDFDTYLMVLSPGGDELLAFSDDHDGSTGVSHVEFTAANAGIHSMCVTSAFAAETGSYELTILRPSSAGSEEPDTAGVRRIRGRLEDGDATTETGSYTDAHSVSGTPGETLTVGLHSDVFDPVLFLTDGRGETLDWNDDSAGMLDSRLAVRVPESGVFHLSVVTFDGSGGDYELTITPGEEGASRSVADLAMDLAAGGTTTQRGVLDVGDAGLPTGEYFDTLPLTLAEGEEVDLELRAWGFDPYLCLLLPSGESLENDDSDAGSLDSRLVHVAAEAGEYHVLVTSSQPEAVGRYQLSVTRSGAPERSPVAAQVREGVLDSGDPTLDSGEWYETHDLELHAGVTYEITLESADFDPYLGVHSPSGDITEDDDGGEGLGSSLSVEPEESGLYHFVVTTASPWATGAYVLTVAPEGGAETNAVSPDPAGDGSTLVPGVPVAGELAAGDEQLENGEYHDVWFLHGSVGQTVTFELRSESFDTFLVLIDAEGDILQNDDFEGARGASRIELNVETDGVMAVLATSYRGGESGSYSLVASVEATSAAPGSGGGAVTSGRVYGVFVGVSDYPGSSNDLPQCDADAVRFQRALTMHAGLREEDSIVLLNREARRESVLDAIRDLAARAAEGDTFVFFFSGHGNRMKRPNLLERDPDGHDALDETIELHDGPLLDDELDGVLTAVGGGTVLIVLDSCFSGGFAKDVISRPGRMGLFSSHEDVTSATAAKFQAGGFLAVFVSEAVGEGSEIADEDRDGLLNAAELSQYVYEGYRNELVRSKSGDTLSVADNLGYQQLIVDRGGVSVLHPLFRMR